MALRGDLPDDSHCTNGKFQYANEPVAFIRKETSDYINLIIAVYPEMYHQAPCFETDLQTFAGK